VRTRIHIRSLIYLVLCRIRYFIISLYTFANKVAVVAAVVTTTITTINATSI